MSRPFILVVEDGKTESAEGEDKTQSQITEVVLPDSMETISVSYESPFGHS